MRDGRPARADEDERRLGGRVVEDGTVGGLVHGGHPRAVVLAREAGDVHLERHGAHGGLEVEERVGRDVEPFGDVVRVGLVRVRVRVMVR